MAFDGIVCSAVVAELNNSILNGKVNKIFQPNKNEIVLSIYSNGNNYALNINIDSANYRANLTTHSKPNPKNVLNFCMVLRKHLMGSTISKIYINGLERIIYIDLDCYNELNDLITKTLVIELMGKHSNIILLNSNNVIIDSLRHLSRLDNSNRDIQPGYKYIQIESDKIDFRTCTFDTFYNTLIKNDNIELSNNIANNFNGICKLGVQCILNELSITNSSNNTLDEYKKVYAYLKTLISYINSDCSNIQCITFQNNYYIINSKNSENLQTNFFIDDYYYNKESNELFSSKQNNLLRLILDKVRKLKVKLNTANKTLAESEKREKYRLYGELITANLYKIQNYNQNSITLENYYDNNNKITIPLDASISPSNNSKRFFKKYRKLQNASAIVNKQKELVENELSYLDSLVYDTNNAETIEDLDSIYEEISSTYDLDKSTESTNNKSSKDASKNLPSEYKIDGFTVLVGKNNKQNDNLTCKIARNNDLWFHTKDIHGSHVVLRLDKNVKQVPDSIVYKCATIAAFFSKAKLSQNVPVDYTYIKYVRKPNGAKPGMVIYLNNKTLYVNPQNPNLI